MASKARVGGGVHQWIDRRVQPKQPSEEVEENGINTRRADDRQEGTGCHLGQTLTDALAYADDVTLLAPTCSALKSMLAIAEIVGSNLHIKFNAAKSQLLLLNPGQHREVSLHVGIRSSLWNLQDAAPYFCASRKCLRRLLHLPRTTHCHLLRSLVHSFYPDYQIYRRSIHFISVCSTSENVIVQRSFKEIILGSRSAVSESLTIVCAKYNLGRENLSASLKKPIAEPNRTTAALRDFMLLREEDLSTLRPHRLTTAAMGYTLML
ncbi:hypothetical protein CAPTEDRAFT_188762 [Capitella teleta]|uniref:Reverse transcriptase domain-containing protein n=1 Tax=Capitella teleta TaxID=283909 RepID=R7TD02_CAPTE|nr:hypothetical protein CAPTEDRAFT_188762 [Capitella teleta]|eukprot:ELT91609.1 hypothetical protein CAPTEDRAFT_188762 [Capitella teleta]